MTRFTSLFTVLCYFTVTFLEKGAIVLCILVSCGFSEPAEATDSKSKCRPCSEQRAACGSAVSSTPAPAKEIQTKPCLIFIDTSESFKRRCECNLSKPNLTATYEQHKNNNLHVNENYSEKIYCACDWTANLLSHQSRPVGIHYIIPTTILLI